MKLWICIPVHNRVELTLKCLESLHAQDYADYEIVICDDGSTDGTSERIREHFPSVNLLQGDGNLWWTGAINRCVEYVLVHTTDNTDCIVALNDDLEAPSNYLSTLADAASRYPGSIIASAEYDINTRRISSVGNRLSWLTARGKPIDPLKDCDPNDKTIASISEASGRGTLIPLSIFQKIGLYDERHLPHYGSDYDFSYRASRAGCRVMVCLAAHVFSHTEKTGLTDIRQDFSFCSFYRYLTNIKSPANLKARWWIAVNNCPKFLLPTFLILDVFFVTGSYFKFHLSRLRKENK